MLTGETFCFGVKDKQWNDWPVSHVIVQQVKIYAQSVDEKCINIFKLCSHTEMSLKTSASAIGVEIANDSNVFAIFSLVGVKWF